MNLIQKTSIYQKDNSSESRREVEFTQEIRQSPKDCVLKRRSFPKSGVKLSTVHIHNECRKKTIQSVILNVSYDFQFG